MKKSILILAIASIALSSCVSKRELLPSSGTDCGTEQKTATACGGRLWITFIPIGIGPRKYEPRKERAVSKFMRQNNCTGITNAKLVDKRVTVPLILVTVSVKWTKVTGTPCGVKK